MMISARPTTLCAWLVPLALALAASAVPSAAFAQPKPDPKAGGQEGDKEPEPPPPPPPVPVPDTGGWGIGGKEPEGKYTPKGKTGKLKDKEDEEEQAKAPEAPEDLAPPGYLYVDSVIGVGDERVVVQPSGRTALFPTGSFIIATGYRFEKMWGVGVRFGIGSGKVDGPQLPAGNGRDHDLYKRIATGGLELSFTPYIKLKPNLHLPVGLALTAPTQGGDMNADVDNLADRGTAVVNQAQTEIRGWEDRAMFTPHRFGITPFVGVRYDKQPFEVTADMKIEIMPKVAGNAPENGAAASQGVESRTVVANWQLAGSFFYHFFDGYLAPGLRMWIAAGNMPEASSSSTSNQKYDGAEFVIEPSVKTTVPFTQDRSTGLNAQLGWVLPFAGRGGAQAVSGANSAWAWGFRIRTGLFF